MGGECIVLVVFSYRSDGILIQNLSCRVFRVSWRNRDIGDRRQVPGLSVPGYFESDSVMKLKSSIINILTYQGQLLRCG